MHYTYILYSRTFDKHYVGMTSNLEVRLKTHNSGKVKSTKPYIPWERIYEESWSSLTEARKREKYLKSAAGRRFRKNMGH